MAEAGDNQSSNVWPMVKFLFIVKTGTAEFVFQEVTALSSETQNMEYSGPDNKVYSTDKMPGIKKYSNITLKKGHFKGDRAMWDRYNSLKMNNSKRESVVISLLDEENQPAMTWNLQNAFPVKIIYSDTNSDANNVAIESIELAHEGLVIATP